jgi:hypothetical protein
MSHDRTIAPFSGYGSRTARGPDGAWQKFERGEMSLKPFYQAFGRELSDATHGNAAYQTYCARKRIGALSSDRTTSLVATVIGHHTV